MKFQTVLIAVACGVLLVAAHADTNSTSQVGRYQLVADTQSPNVWRLDTATGEIYYCIGITEVHRQPDCYSARFAAKNKSPYDP